jgi:hypothetical protein
MVWVSGRKQSIPLADPLCLKEVRDSSVSSKRGGSTLAVSAQTSGVESTAGQPNHRGGFFRGTSEHKTITYPLCTQYGQRHPGDCSAMPGRCYICRGEHR